MGQAAVLWSLELPDWGCLQLASDHSLSLIGVQEAEWDCSQRLPDATSPSQACCHSATQRGCQGRGEACGSEHRRADEDRQA